MYADSTDRNNIPNECSFSRSHIIDGYWKYFGNWFTHVVKWTTFLYHLLCDWYYCGSNVKLFFLRFVFCCCCCLDFNELIYRNGYADKQMESNFIWTWTMSTAFNNTIFIVCCCLHFVGFGFVVHVRAVWFVRWIYAMGTMYVCFRYFEKWVWVWVCVVLSHITLIRNAIAKLYVSFDTVVISHNTRFTYVEWHLFVLDCIRYACVALWNANEDDMTHF